MPQPYQTFQKFNDPQLAAAIGEQLQKNGIDHRIEKEAPLLDATIIGNDLGSTIHLKIAGEDFTRAHAILEEYYVVAGLWQTPALAKYPVDGSRPPLWPLVIIRSLSQPPWSGTYASDSELSGHQGSDEYPPHKKLEDGVIRIRPHWPLSHP
jgi:hypothetical protein